MLELHRRLNRADVSKDAKNTRVVVTNDVLFDTCADNLFGRPAQTYAPELKAIKASIDGICKMTHGKIFPKARIPILRHPLDSYTHVLPDNVMYAIQDSGLAPEEFKHDLKFVITPASYLDSAGRSGFDDDIYFGFNAVLTQKQLQTLGIHHIQTITPVLRESNTCDVHLNFTFGKELRVQFNNAFSAVRGNKEFFAGNPTKNNWFNTTRSLSTNAIETGQMLILCKEIGDTLQAYYGKQFERSLGRTGSNKVCLFTSDSILTLRCRMLDLPVVVLDAEKKELKQYECFYYPSAGIVDKDIQDVFQQYVCNHNTSVLHVIDRVLHQGMLLLDNCRVALNARIRQTFSNLKNNIHTLTTYSVRRMDTSYLTIQQYKEQITPFIVDHLFDSTLNVLPVAKLCPASAHTFPGGDFKSYIRSISTGRADHHGGGEPPTANIANNGNRLADQLRQELYEILQALFPEDSENVWRKEVLFNDLFRMFFYVGEVTLDRSFLQEYVQSAQPMSLSDFKTLYVTWKKKTFDEDYEDDIHLYPVPPPPPYEDRVDDSVRMEPPHTVQVAAGKRRRRKTRKYRPRIKILPDDRFEPNVLRNYIHDTRRNHRSARTGLSSADEKRVMM